MEWAWSPFAWVWPLIAAPFVGSFLCVLIRRLPRGHLLHPARSCCEHCGAPIRLRDLIPLISAIALQGRCRDCGAPIAAQHGAVEAAALAVAASAVLAGIGPAALWPACGLGWALLALGWIDWDAMLLPDVLTLPLLVAGLVATWFLSPGLVAMDLVTDHAIAAASAWAGLEALAIVYRRLRHRDGIGGGDAKLLGAIGAWTGLAALPWVLLGGALIALAVVAAMGLRGRAIRPTTAVPFGPCLALAGWAMFLAQA